MMEQKIIMPEIGFDMPITDLVLELEKLRYKVLEGTTHPLVFMQIKNVFHMLESIGSSRIEGNNTSIRYKRALYHEDFIRNIQDHTFAY